MSNENYIPAEWIRQIITVFNSDETDFEKIAFELAAKYPQIFLECATDANPLKVLTKGVDKIADIKAVRQAKCMDLPEAKKLVESFHDYK